MIHSRKLFYVLQAVLLFTVFSPCIILSQDYAANPALNQGIADLKAENYEEAVANLTKARKNDPSSSIAAYYLGLAYKQQQEYKEAIIHLKDAVTLRPGVKDGFLDLAELYYYTGQSEESLKQLGFAEEKNVRPAQTAFLKGLVLMRLERNKEAMEAFNKAKSLEASLVQAANYQIGVALIKEGKGEEAGTMFREVIIADPNSDMAQIANQYIEALSRRAEEERPLRLSVGASYQYDDNVILKPSDQTASGGITGEEDSVYIATFRAEYAPRFSGPLGIKAQYSLYYNDHEKFGSYDVISQTLALVPGYTTMDSMLNMLLSYNYTWVDDDEYLRAGTVSPGYTFMPWPDQMAQAALRYQKKEYLKPPFTMNEDRDAQEYAASLGWFYFFAGAKGFVNVKYEISKEDTEGKNWAYIGNKGSLNIALPLSRNTKLTVSGETYYQQFDETNTNFLKKRKDTTYTALAMLSYEIIRKWEIQLQHVYIRDDSNIAVYDYDKNITSIGVEVKY